MNRTQHLGSSLSRVAGLPLAGSVALSAGRMAAAKPSLPDTEVAGGERKVSAIS
ncbi:MAG: hypothetical protein QUV05_08480 [Phycisphaerae bacterium]|nr:hypothetical protein [Phycisphaerae bacterium]